MSDDIKARATGRARFCRDRGEVKTPMLLEALADRIEALEAENARLRDALAGMIHVWEEISKAVPPMINQPEFLTAQAALDQDNPEKEQET